MKKLIFLLLILLWSSAAAQVYEEGVIGNNGVPLIRFHNNTPVFLSCYYKDQANYFTFNLAPRTTSQWYPSYGYYEWECN